MAIDVEPIIGNWYRAAEQGQIFEVIALDEDNDLIEVQYFDGSVDAFDLDAWDELEVEPIEAPEDWTGPLDELEQDDISSTDPAMDPGEDGAPVRVSPQPRAGGAADEGLSVVDENELEQEEPDVEEDEGQG